MIGPASGGTVRGSGAPSRATGSRGTVGAVLVVLALGLALRLIIAYLLPGSGFATDLNAFDFWARNLAAEGPFGFYQRDFFHDYTPGYLYALWFIGWLVAALHAQNWGDTIPFFQAFGLKVVPILADLAIGWLVHSMILELGGRRRLALLGAAVAVLNPISWFDSVVWGQVDSVGVVFMLLGLRELWRDRPERAAMWAVVAAVIKPQLGIMIPLVAVVTIRRALWPAGGGGDPARTGRPVRILTTGLAGFLTAVVLCLPFGLSVVELSGQAPFIRSGLLQQVAVAAGGYPYLTVNAYNPWAIVRSDLGFSLANANHWVCDFAGSQSPSTLGTQSCASGSAAIGGIPAVLIGSGLLLATIALTLWIVARRPDRLMLLVGLAVLALAFFVVPTRVHERYGYPFFPLGVILAAVSVRWRMVYVALSAATFANMYVVLTTLYPENPSIMDWLGLGPTIRSEAVVTMIALVHGVAFVWALLQLRRDALEPLADSLAAAATRPDDAERGPVGDPFVPPPPATRQSAGPESVDARVDGEGPPEPIPVAEPAASPPVSLARATRTSAGVSGTPSTAASAPLPTWRPRATFTELGMVGWLRARLGAPPIRPDRSAILAAEGGGRLDRLDLLLVVVLVLASLILRTFRLAEPYQMHFDEVYHARTATEFLQDWRYGIEHDIYEWTHPHLAKYAMAAGLVLWGGDEVRATSALGVSVRAAAIEPRRASPGSPGGRTGERLHVATGSEIRTYDLRTRALRSVVQAAGVSALAFDPTANQLIVGYDDGRLATLDATTLGVAGLDIGPEPVALATVDHSVARLIEADDGTTIVAASSDRLSLVDLASARVVGSLDLPDIADLAPGGSGAALVATLAEVTDPSAVAAKLTELLGAAAQDYETKLADPLAGPTVVLGSPGSDEVRSAVTAAIADGSLPGVAIEDVARIAVATADGIVFVDAARGAVVTTIGLAGGAHGLAVVTGLDDTKLYVTAGDPSDPVYTVVAIAGDSAKDGPADLGSHPLPGPGTEVVYDEASQQVHILGRIAGAAGSDADPWTVYVVEPHANAVYADARLPRDFRPVALAADIEPTYPSDDPQRLLLLDGSGATAEIGLGSHAFAWRLPGVIAGALTAGLLFLLARILFRRRLVAAFAGLFVLVDGMFFVQSRIGMNDVYVGLFIVAAYTLFAALWAGWLRGRLAFWLAMPAIGFLLGLALASKWVAAYAIGGLLLLILVRSALGRVLVILGLIAITGVLGYIAISVPEGAGFGNLTFLLVMVALTLVAVVVAIVHPIAWTDDEMRFAAIGPAAAGALVFFGALGLGRLDMSVVLGSLAFTPLQLAVALGLASPAVVAVFWLAGRWGFGPLAALPAPDDPVRRLEPPAPPPDGWLRPGWGLGLPLGWGAACLVVLPIAVYVISYLPWAMIEGHQIIPGWPAGHIGQTLLDLTGQMYRYHNDLTAAHPASSPWWAWPLNLKPVWFYQEGLAGGTSASVYDAGNLVIWWLGIPAMAFVAFMAFKRRSLALALIAIGFAAQWIPWARIDRAAFQYHYYTALPFVVLALAYFVAELWHGASRRTWQLARVAAAISVAGPAVIWILSRPLCGFVGVLSVNPGSQACPAVIPNFIVTARSGALTLVVGVGLIVIFMRFLDFDGRSPRAGRTDAIGAFGSLLGAGLAVVAGLIVAAFLPDTPVLTLTAIPVEPIALVIGAPLAYLAFQLIGATDPRRFATGIVVAAVGWFTILYPNIAALPLPAAVVNAYQGILPTYLYAFQFPVSTVSRSAETPLLTPTLAILLGALAVTCLVVAYSTWVWRLALAESTVSSDASEGASETDGLARTGGA
ncbi:MAG: phospholipid carrier-dependent glycosyltransferase [Candidatus Limnocylindrales bacterium]|nr:phospholipid carrier-dependent glycosyltransferase [Candidatus Limnocylindrales bacterium]